jgi:hypothetical protein
VYLTVVREQNPLDSFGVDDETLVAVGQAFCDAADEANDFDAAATASALLAIENDIEVTFMGSVMGAAVVTFCPQWSDDMDAFIASHT